MISKEHFLAMHELRRQGVTIGRIAEQYKISRDTVSRWLSMTGDEFDMHRHGNAVTIDNMIKYQKTQYEMPHALVKKGELLRVVENDGLLMFYRVDDGSLIFRREISGFAGCNMDGFSLG